MKERVDWSPSEEKMPAMLGLVAHMLPGGFREDLSQLLTPHRLGLSGPPVRNPSLWPGWQSQAPLLPESISRWFP